ncbi:MAG: hypothetical protein Q7N50_08800 [Armatimonadota bacterium]|nr:hypothetical protein [Armatimonadota bacterium]
MKLIHRQSIVAGLCLLVLLLSAVSSYGELSGGSVIAGEATENSIYNFTVVWQQEDGRSSRTVITMYGVVMEPDPIPPPPEVDFTDMQLNPATMLPLPVDSAVVEVKAMETLSDTNGNGIWDIGESFVDQNFNGVWDVARNAQNLITDERTGTLDPVTGNVRFVTPLPDPDPEDNPNDDPNYYRVKIITSEVVGSSAPIELHIAGGIYPMEYVRGSNAGGATYRVRLSAGLNLANDPTGVPGVRYAPGLKASHPNYHQMLFVGHDYDPESRTTTDYELNLRGPRIMRSRSAYPGRFESVTATNTQTITAPITPLRYDLTYYLLYNIKIPDLNELPVRAVYIEDESGNIDYSTDYYATGGSVDIDTGVITLGTQLPQAVVDGALPVWVEYTPYPTGTLPRYGSSPLVSSTGVDRLWRGISDPLFAEGYPDPRWPFDPQNQDDGATSTAFVFKVRYYNNPGNGHTGLPPQPWLPEWVSPEGYFEGWNSGVVLFLDKLGTGDYEPYFMRKTDETDNVYSDSLGCEYVYRVEPAGGWFVYGGAGTIPHFSVDNLYEALQLGRYHYFFAASDDYLKDEDGYLYYNSKVPVSGFRTVRGMSLAGNWWTQWHKPPYFPGDSAKTSYTSYDHYIYADVSTYTPGVGFDSIYPGIGTQHPNVRPSLTGPGAPFPEGEELFLGTLSPYYRMVNPSYYYPGHAGHGGHAYIETAGQASSTRFTFKLLYKSQNPDVPNPLLDNGIPPIWIRVYINNAPDHGTIGSVNYTPGMTMPADPHMYVGYNMQPAPGQTLNYAQGVLYQFETALPRGPHTYYFEAFDGVRYVHFPVRPDGRTLMNGANPQGSDWWEDMNVPGDADLANNNDHIPGPYVNNAPVLSNPRVSPSSGPQGTSFRVTINYKDADNQRHYSAYMYLQIRDSGTLENGGIIKVAMYPTDPSSVIDPNPDKFRNGMDYYADISSREGAVLQPGVRLMKFEFEDDWGYPTYIEDKVRGEMSKFPAGGDNWIAGPVIELVKAPTLKNGSVTTVDGTQTSATVWRYAVTYTHPNDKAPSYVNVYIGKRAGTPTTFTRLRIRPADENHVIVTSLPITSVTGVWDNPSGTGTNYHLNPDTQEPGGFDSVTGVITLPSAVDPIKDVYITYSADPIAWDSGHSMSKANISDNVYADGVLYELQMRLSGSSLAGEPGYRYVYAFEASDGSLSAVYNPNLALPETSDSAYAIVDQAEPLIDLDDDGVRDDGETFIDNDGDDFWDDGPEPFIDSNDNGVWDTGETYTDIAAPGNNAGKYDTGAEILSTTDFTVYSFAHDMIAGPLPVTEPAPPGVIAEPRIYRNGRLLARDETHLLNSTLYPPLQLNPDATRKIINLGSYADRVDRVIAVRGTALGNFDYYGASTDSYYDKTAGSIYIGGSGIPSGQQAIVEYVWEKDYYIDYVDGKVIFHLAGLSLSDLITADYWFTFTATGPESVGRNTPPVLTEGKVAPSTGTSITPFVYSVIYTDTDGIYGQAPEYVRAYIDGAYYPMTSSITGAADYTRGVVYTLTTTVGAGLHRFHFEASDGSGFALFDMNGSTSNDYQIPTIVDISGPTINDIPVLQDGKADPNPAAPATISAGQAVTYSVTYTDADNDAPENGYPRVWIDNPTQVLLTGTVSSGGVTESTLTDSTQTWTPDTLKGKIVQITYGAAKNKVYLISGNTGATLTVIPAALATDGLLAGNTFQIGAATLVKRLTDESTYTARFSQVLSVDADTFGFLTGVTVDKTRVSGVLGVYLTPDATGFNFFAGGAYDINTGKIELGVWLPPGTTTAYVYHGVSYIVTVPNLLPGDHAFHFSTVVTQGLTTPVTVRLPVIGEITGPKVGYETLPPGVGVPTLSAPPSPLTYVTPAGGASSQLFTFRVKYADPDGDPPTYNNGLYGFANVIIEFGGGGGITWALSAESPTPDYVAGATLVSTPISLPAGAHRFYFTASDGYSRDGGKTVHTVRHPTPTTSYAGTITVNAKPTLSAASVSPADGNRGNTFTYSVRYADADSQAPMTGEIYVLIDGSLRKDLTGPTLPNYRTGAVYTVVVPAADLPGVYGNHTYEFFAKDSYGESATTVSGSGPQVRDEAHFENPSVTPDTGNITTTFTYAVDYVGPSEPSSVLLLIDGDTTGIAMTKGSGTPATGIHYTLNRQLSSGGVHTYTFKALPDNIVYSPTLSGPTIPIGITLLPSADPVDIGETIDVHIVLTPAQATTLKLTVIRPDGAVELGGEEDPYEVQTDSNGAYDLTALVMSYSGTWTIAADWDGDENNDPIHSEETVEVDAPSYDITANSWDMICPPLAVESGDPADLFGRYPDDSPGSVWVANSLRVTRYRPSTNSYVVYGVNPFPMLQPGDAFWIKPSKYWLEAATTYPLEAYGRLLDQTQPCEITLSRGWNQFGSVYMLPINWSSVQVNYNGQLMSMSSAARAGYIRDFAWGWSGAAYFYVHATSTRTDVEVRRILEPWKGYWIRSLVDECKLVLNPPSVSAASTSSSTRAESLSASPDSVTIESSDGPPPPPR